MRHMVRRLYVDGLPPDLFHQSRRSSTIRPSSASATAMLGFCGIADHALTCCWLDPVANDLLRSCLGVRFLRRNRENSGRQRPDQSVNLSHAPGHKTPDRYIWMEVVVDRPDHGAPGLVRHIDYGIVWHIDPDHLFGVHIFR